MSLSVSSPLAGTVIAVEDVPDPVFADRIIGPGLAVDPDRAHGDAVVAVAPVSGIVTKLYPHAFIVTDTDDRSVLVHLGLDTVELGGAGFTLHVAQGAQVVAGDPVVTWCPASVEAGGRNPIVPVVALQADDGKVALSAVGMPVAPGGRLFTWA
ncbi:PTS glucose transporter subunit IIA [Actinomyces sp. MRS3W]|uniref:PTS sugar transporter subunit IIA n=1 Tax=Actinomyces sp. MRS3W TaxID=2800796 RepID=UPI0028FDB1D9|nr:PTS glucose transporter subunit IIA [Actinomyces sp. MRS3W]MDU0347655.1 PTS glucose transporter subunit IIA [Actinomyces sp. MRS3W]